MTASLRRAGAWLAIFGLLLQAGLGAAHSARHFDHVVGYLVLGGESLAAAELSSEPGCPAPLAPASPGIDRCAIGLGLAVSGNGVLPAADIVPLPPAGEAARLDGEPQVLAAAARRHLLPPARAPPAVAIWV